MADVLSSVGMFLASRFIIGFGLVFANTYAPVLIGELAHPKDRVVITSLYQTSWLVFSPYAHPQQDISARPVVFII